MQIFDHQEKRDYINEFFLDQLQDNNALNKLAREKPNELMIIMNSWMRYIESKIAYSFWELGVDHPDTDAYWVLHKRYIPAIVVWLNEEQYVDIWILDKFWVKDIPLKETLGIYDMVDWEVKKINTLAVIQSTQKRILAYLYKNSRAWDDCWKFREEISGEIQIELPYGNWHIDDIDTVIPWLMVTMFEKQLHTITPLEAKENNLQTHTWLSLQNDILLSKQKWSDISLQHINDASSFRKSPHIYITKSL